MPRVLIIDDDQELYSLLASYLQKEGFNCYSALEGNKGLDLIRKEPWDIVILDVMLAGINGIDLLRHIRSDPTLNHLPILMLSARAEEIDKVLGLEIGADDYLTKPFSARELTARLRVLLRRSSYITSVQNSGYQVDNIVITPGVFHVKTGGQNVELTATEWRLLHLLTTPAGKVVDRQYLYRSLYGHGAYIHDRSLDMLVSRLRKKIGPRSDGGERIKAVRGEGYVFLSGEMK